MLGELKVANFFREYLDGWEIYHQPHINGKKPDFALLHPKIGVGIFEVKDWDLSRTDWHKYRNAIEQARLYRSIFAKIFLPRHRRTDQVPVTVGLIFPRASDSDVERCFAEFLDSGMYTTLAGRDTLESGNVEKIFPSAVQTPISQPAPKTVEDVRSWLLGSSYERELREPLNDDPKQKRIVTNAAGIKLRRIRGTAGSGKSTALVRRAANLAAQGKDILFVYYNNSLEKYLRGVCKRTEIAYDSQIDWVTFHFFLGSLLSKIGLDHEFKRLREGGWDSDIPEYVFDALENNAWRIKRYDAIYIDEGQDFNLDWWKILRHCLKPDGEMMIAFDVAQKIYPRTDWNAETLPGAGFSGRWIELGGSRRLPNRLLPLLRTFADEFHPTARNALPDQTTGMDTPCELRWVQTSPANRVRMCVDELIQIIQRDQQPQSKPLTDLVLICDRSEDCLEAERILARYNINVYNTHSTNHKNVRQKKKNFDLGLPSIKISTMQSFKGWQARLIVICISYFSQSRPADAATIYTSLTRLKSHDAGSNLSVVCSALQLQAFGRRFPDYEDRS